MNVTRYTPKTRDEWDAFIRSSKNGTFLFDRGYMDYHADRFDDHSLVFRDDRGRLKAVFPAHQVAGILFSHGGLTYGGVISDATMTTPIMLEIFDRLLAYCRAAGISKILYKTVPSIYAQHSAQEDEYALYRHNATLVRRDVLSIIERARRLSYQERRTRKIRQAQKAGVVACESLDLTSFWRLLEENLKARHGATPVHSLNEIELLSSRFPAEIRLHVSQNQAGDVLAGVLLYLTSMVCHVQYIATSSEGRQCGALDLLFADLIEQRYQDKRYFDFGISTEDDGKYLNFGLIEQKEGFGARAIVHDIYEIEVS